MKLVQLERDALLKPLQAVTGIVEKRHTLPILSNVLLERRKNQLSLVATDLEIQVATSAEAGKGGDEDASLTVSARKLQDILRSLPEGTEATLDVQNNRLQVRAGKSRFNLQTLPAADFPAMADPGATQAKVSMPQKALRELLMLVQYAMAQQDIRYYLNGLLLVLEGGMVRVVATDGHRLSYAARPLGQQQDKREVILPRKAVQELGRLLGEGDEPVVIEITRGWCRLITRNASPSSARNCCSPCSARPSCRTRSSAACAGWWPRAACASPAPTTSRRRRRRNWKSPMPGTPLISASTSLICWTC
jgi:DNA polymerase-3 subunit beta